MNPILSHFQTHDPKLASIAKHYLPQISISPVKDLFADLCETIIGQQLSNKAARTIINRVKAIFPSKKFDPKTIEETPELSFRGAGCSGAKTRALKDAADHVLHKNLDLEKLRSLSNEEVVEKLLPIKGVGNWTAEMFLMFSLGREDVFSFGDLGLRKAVMKLYSLKEMPTPEQLEKLSKKWAPYRTYAALILWKSLDAPIEPKRESSKS